MSDTVGLTQALDGSTDQKALYDHEGRRAFVSRRGPNYDFAVRTPSGQATRLNQTDEVLQTVLVKYGVPNDKCWVSQ